LRFLLLEFRGYDKRVTVSITPQVTAALLSCDWAVSATRAGVAGGRLDAGVVQAI
jgi:hypothetical protein